MKDVEKTSVERQNSSKRLRRRRRRFNIYAFVVMLLVVTAGITISYTFLFNIGEIRVSGESDMYTAEEIVSASGVHEGENLLRLDPKKSEQAILDKLLYVETAKVKRKFPSSLEIKVTKCIPAYNVNYEGGTLLVSKKGKILADNGFVTDGLPVVYGYEPSVTKAGKALESGNSHKNDAFGEFMDSLLNTEDTNITAVDLSDEFSIVVSYKNGMTFRMGNWKDVNYKLDLADSVMNDESVKGKKGYLTMIGANQCSFRNTHESGASTDTTKPVATDADGNPVEKETNPEQQKIFEDYNKQGGGQDSNGQNNGGAAQQDNNNAGWDNGGGYDNGGGWDNGGYDNGGGWDNGGYDNGGGWDDGNNGGDW